MYSLARALSESFSPIKPTTSPIAAKDTAHVVVASAETSVNNFASGLVPAKQRTADNPPTKTKGAAARSFGLQKFHARSR